MRHSIWTILETYSLVQGFLMGLYAFFIMRRTYLTFLLLSISLLILAHLYYYFEWYFEQPDLIFLEASLWYLIGPLFYLFVLGLFGKGLRWQHFLHFIPFLSFLIFIFPFYFEAGDTKLKVLENLFSEASYQVDINRYLFSAHILLYIVWSYLTFNRNSLALKQVNASSSLEFDTLVSFILKYYLIFSFLGFIVYMLIGGNYSWANGYYELYYVGLSFLIHFIFYYCLIRSRDLEGTSGEPEVKERESKYRSSSLSSAELDDIIHQVTSHVAKQEVYRNSELRIRMVSDELGIPSHHISQAINQNLKKSFFDLVNGYRVEGLTKNIKDPKYRHYTLVGIASEHGFKSPSSFYRIFKKYTGKTPKDYFSQE